MIPARRCMDIVPASAASDKMAVAPLVVFFRI